MKKILFEKAYQPFFLTALISLGIAVFFFGAHPDSTFDVSFYSFDASIFTYSVWLFFSGYLFVLAGIYFTIGRTKLKTKRWLVISHYVFIVLFLIFFIIFCSFSNQDVQNILAGIPLATLLTIYGIISFVDIVFFLFGLTFLFINLFSLRKDKAKRQIKY